MVHALEIALVLLGTVVILEVLARQVALPSPFLLLPAGIILGFMPHFPQITLDPDIVMFVFLPILVYAGSALGSWVEFRKNLQPITLLSIGCVLFTTVCIALIAHAIVPGFGWAPAFILGAIVSPPDEVAAISIARRLGIPKGVSAVLEGEGLVNDAAALTIYRFAAAAVITHSFSLTKAASSFTLVVFGEILWGLGVGWAMLRIRRMLNNTSLEVSLSLLTPFVAYLPAEVLGGTGVLATVAAGLYVSYMNSHLVRATTRLQVIPVWQTLEFTLDGILFLAAGMQLHRILQPLYQTDHGLLCAYGLGISFLVIVTRIFWVFAVAHVQKLFGRAFQTKPTYICSTIHKNKNKSARARAPFPSWQRLFIVSWSGMRGAVSLAAALSLPLVTGIGTPFPGRDLIIYLTFCVIVSTLLLQGLSLPWLIRFLGIDREGRQERSEAGHQEIEARRQAAEASLELLAAKRKEGTYPEALLDRMAEEYRYRNAQFRAHLDGDHDGAVQHGTHKFNMQSELIDTERHVMLEMRQSGVIDDDILRRIEKDLDLQEMRLRQGISEYELSAEDRLG